MNAFEGLFWIVSINLIYIDTFFAYLAPKNRSNVIGFVPFEEYKRAFPFCVYLTQPVVQFLYG